LPSMRFQPIANSFSFKGAATLGRRTLRPILSLSGVGSSLALASPAWDLSGWF
jgi:hypothetical protein